MDFRYTKLALAVGLSIYAVGSYSQEGNDRSQIETMVITAQKVDEDEQDIAISTTTFSADALERSGTNNTQELLSRTPNVHMIKAGNPSDASFISIRGVSPVMGGRTVQYQVDGVSLYSFDTELLDVERVEVLRGPQGTLYGRNTSSGVINVITKEPDFISEGQAGITVGNYNNISGNLISGGAVADSDIWAYRTALQYTKNDGYFTQKNTGDDDIDEIQNFNGRIKLRRAPTDSNWDITTTLSINQIRNGNTSFNSVDNLEEDSHTIDSEVVGYSDADIFTASVKASHEGNDIDFVSLTSYSNEKKDEYYDLDFGDYSDYGVSYTLSLNDTQRTLAQELRWSSKQNQKLRWLAGVYLQNETLNYDIDMDFGTSFTIQAETVTNDVASFGNLTYALTNKLELLAGLRLDYENINYDYISTYGGSSYEDYDKSKSYAEVQPKVGANYHVSDDLMYYISISRGYKSGGYYFSAPSEGYAEYDPEYTMNYEFGIKSEWLDNTIKFNSALYWIDWTDQQVEVGTYPLAYVDNAASTVSRGVEAELIWTATQDLQLFANGAYTNAYFKEYSNDGEDYSGNTPTNAPEYTYSLGVDYHFMTNYFVYLDYNVTGNTYFDVENTFKQGAYGLANLRTGYSTDVFDVTLWVKNLSDEDYLTRAIQLDGDDTWYARSGDPRTFGIDVNYKW